MGMDSMMLVDDCSLLFAEPDVEDDGLNISNDRY